MGAKTKMCECKNCGAIFSLKRPSAVTVCKYCGKQLVRVMKPKE